MPPTYCGSASRTVTGTFFLDNRYAAVKPAGPAPMIATEVLAMSLRSVHNRATSDTVLDVPLPIRGRVESFEPLAKHQEIHVLEHELQDVGLGWFGLRELGSIQTLNPPELTIRVEAWIAAYEI